MFIDVTARTEIGAQLDTTRCGFEVVVDHVDEEATFQIALGDASHWLSEEDFTV